MRLNTARTVAIVLALLLAISPAFAVIKRLTPLKEAIDQEQSIFVARVEQLDPDKPSVILTPVEDLKGKAPVAKLAVLLKGDSEAEREKQTEKILKRLAPDLPIVLFVSLRGTRYTCFAYTNGTWFQLQGMKDGDRVRWSFLHLEPYLRRTYKGTTEELRKVIADAVAGKARPPEPKANEEPGIGPEVKATEKPKEKGAVRPPRGANGPLFAVIPTVLIGGPLAVLALLFPTVFGGLIVFFRRWMVAFSVLATNSTLYFLYDFFRGDIKDFWWGKPAVLWIAMTALASLGALWSWRRSLADAQQTTTAPMPPTRAEHVLLLVMSLSGLVLVGLLVWQNVPLLSDIFKLVLVLWVGVWLGHLYVLFTLARSTRVMVPAEGVVLTGMVLACTALGLGTLAPAAVAIVGPGEEPDMAESRIAVTPPELVWQPVEARDRGQFDSSAVVDGDRVFIAAAHSSGFSATGRMYCFDRNTGKELWSFDDGGNLKQVFSTPAVAGGKIYFGEGLHQDRDCKLFCLNADNGDKVWEFLTGSHTESSPTVINGRVYFGAGDDGVYCVDAAKGEKKWHYPGLHVDSSPAVVAGRVYAGSGVGDVYRETMILCLDAADGKEIWKVPVDLPAWGSANVSNGQVFVGLGNGNYYESDKVKPAGAVLCLEARTGQRLWRCDVSDGVLDKPSLGPKHVWFGARDGNCYCVDRDDGALVWKQPVGSPSVSAVTLARCGLGGGITSVYATGSGGTLHCLDPLTGKPYYVLDLGKLSTLQPQLFSTPAVVVSRKGGVDRRRLYFGAGLNNGASFAAMFYCFEDRLSESE